MKKFIPLISIGALTLTACDAADTTYTDADDADKNGVTVSITNIQENGTLYVALQDEEIFGTANATYGATAESSAVRNGTLDVFIPDVDAGTYAVAIFQDTNGNGQMDVGENGVPTEPWALSYGAGTQGAPKFDDAKIAITGLADQVSITLVN